MARNAMAFHKIERPASLFAVCSTTGNLSAEASTLGLTPGQPMPRLILVTRPGLPAHAYSLSAVERHEGEVVGWTYCTGGPGPSKIQVLND